MPPTPTPSPSPFLVQLVGAADSASWLGPAVTSGIFVIVGAVVALLSTLLSDARRAKREQQQRFHNELLATSSALLVHLDEFTRHGEYLAHLLKSEPHVLARQSTQADILEARSHLLDAGEGFIRRESELRLISPTPVRKLVEALGVNVGVASKLAVQEDPGLAPALHALGASGVSFQDAVRKALTGSAN